MPQIPILKGIYTDENSDYRIQYPRNLVPIVQASGISNGYLRPTDGIELVNDSAPGIGRGGISWNDICYRVLGDQLCRVDADGTITTIGTIPGTGIVTMDYSFDYLSITTDSRFFLYDGTTLAENTDPDLGVVFDHIWIDGYFMLTDGEFIIVTELTDPFQVNPTKYGSSEYDPDPIKAILKVKGEAYILNRHTIEVLQNLGNVGFPFETIEGAQVEKGVIGTHACCLFLDSFAFVGSSRNEAIAVHLATFGGSNKISTREIEQILSEYDETVLSQILCERKSANDQELLYIHLPDRTLVYDAIQSAKSQSPAWHVLTTSLASDLGQYRANHFVWCYNQWLVSDTMAARVGRFVNNIASHWGEKVSWEFSTQIVYNESMGVIFHEIELVALTGRAVLGDDPEIWTDYSFDGVVFSQRRTIKAGKVGDRLKRLVWIRNGPMRTQRIQRFGGDSSVMASFSRLEARLERLAS